MSFLTVLSNLGARPDETTGNPALEDLVRRKRRALGLGFVAVLIPLVVLLARQYLWLQDLQESSLLARQATLQNYLGAVAKEVHYFYVKSGERALNVSDSYFVHEKIDKVASHFKKKDVEGARVLFVVTYVPHEEVYFYDSKKVAMVKPKFSSEYVAVLAAAARWQILRKKGGAIATSGLSVDERDPDNRIILNPITDEKSKLVGLTGMILDEKFFLKKVLPQAVEESFPPLKKKELDFVLRDQEKNVLVSWPDGDKEARTKKEQKGEVWRAFTFVFTDWWMSIRDRKSPEQWARTNFTYNITFSLVLAAVLISGIALALRTASREMKLSAMKNDFVSNVSHELRTPLSSIRVFGEFMRRGRVTEQDKVKEYGEYIETESRRLTQLINNILDFSKIESGRKVYRFEPAVLEEVVEGALSTFGVRLRNSGFEIDYEGPEAAMPEVDLDAGALDHALCNLLDNAVKYSGDEKIIKVTLRKVDGEAQIAVKDRGIGISREEQKRIFERFHRVSTGLVHDVKGAGLGLSIVQHMVLAHGGRVTVESEPGSGSVFTIHLPIESKGTD